MGQRGANAAFMPDRFVFPGGAVDAVDHLPVGEWPLEAETARRLEKSSDPRIARALPFAAIRELYEEVGLVLGRPAQENDDQARLSGWAGSFAPGFVPNLSALRLIFRAVTPPGRSRRFDARFFVADASHTDTEHYTIGDGELRHVQWLSFDAARALPLPFITGIVLSELKSALSQPDLPAVVPFFQHDADGSHFRLL